MNKILIDLDGTLAGFSHWVNFWTNTKGIFSTGLLMEPPPHSWSILTARPKIDYFIIKWFCQKYKLFPESIITPNSLLYNFQNNYQIAAWKTSIIHNMLSKNIFINKIIYVDNDTSILENMISGKQIILCSPKSLNCVLEELYG